VSPSATRALEPLSIAAAIGVSVLVVRQTTDALEALTGLVRAVKELLAEIKGVSEARLEVGEEVRSFDELREEDLASAATAALD
jgi:hypothetical protein